MENQATNTRSVKIQTTTTPGTYTLVCYARNNCGRTSNSRTLTITIPGSGGGGGPTPGCPNPPCETPQPLRVYPNPVDSELTVEVDKNALKITEEGVEEVVEIQLLNSKGNLVYSKKNVNKKITIPVKHLPEGLYYLHLICSDGVIVKQILIQH